MENFLKGFLEQNPQYVGRDFYITGESYAGHYIPAISHHLLFGADVDLNLKGIAIGNGLTDPFHQYPAYSTFSLENGLITEEWSQTLDQGFKACQGLIYESQHGEHAGNKKLQLATMEFCQVLADTCLGNPVAPKFNVYDIRGTCDDPPLCYDFSVSDDFLNNETVQQIIGVSGRKYVECNQLVHTYLLGDWMTNLMPKVAEMLDGTDIEVLVYSGDKDWICNWRGGEAWTAATKWEHQAEFAAQDYEKWFVDGAAAGDMRQFGNFHFLRIFDAGHMVPMDQPENALAMITRLVANDWNLSETTEIVQ